MPPPYRSKLGLDDPRVIKCDDRGDELYNAYPPRRLQRSFSVDVASSSSNCPDIVERLRNDLDNGIKRYPATSSTRIFIPRDLLSSLMTFNTVYLVIDTLSCCSNLPSADKNALAREVYSGGGQRCRSPCRKLLAVLIAIERQDDLVELIEDGIDDNCLPFHVVTSNSNSNSGTLRCRNSDHNHTAIYRLRYNNMRCGVFSQYTYAVMAPYFTKPRNKHVHYILDHNDVLPILHQYDQRPSEAPDVRGSGGVLLDSGGFSQVHVVEFHPSHFHFDPEDHPNEETKYALKKLNSTKWDDFNKELASLLSCQNQDDKHLIKLLVTFEVKGANGTNSSEFSLLFPLAQGNLWHYWNIHQKDLVDPSMRESLCKWMAEQCHQLASALRHVHNVRQDDLKHLPDVDEHNHELYGRHGDVKAENFLWFQRKNILVMTDFGLGRLHSKISASNDTKSIERTATYRAPEFDTKDGKISRACDIYSLGCMFLEFVTWHLEGYNSVHDDFPQHRLEQDHYGFNSDIFFKIKDEPGEPETAIRKPKVTTWIKRLKQNPRCTQYHIEFLDLIEDFMLEPNFRKRIKSDRLERKLNFFVRKCGDTNYYKE